MSDLTEYAWTDKMMMVADRIDQNHILVRYVLAKDVAALQAKVKRLEAKVRDLKDYYGKAQQEKVRPSGEIDPPAPRCSPR